MEIAYSNIDGLVLPPAFRAYGRKLGQDSLLIPKERTQKCLIP